MNSLADECTPTKHIYDSCFNRWFASYLNTSTLPPSKAKDAAMAAKGKELETDCGEFWRAYENCLTKALDEKGLRDMILESRKQEPLQTLAEVDVPEELKKKR